MLMIDFTTRIKEEVDQKIREIETCEDNVIVRSLAASEMFEEVFDRLKQFIAGYTFTDQAEEILFFREVKPRIFCKLLYYRKVYNIEMNRPVGGVDVQSAYLNRELDDISNYIAKRLDFYRYYRSGATHLDDCFFLRGRGRKEEQYRDSFYFERDPVFSTCGDFKVAKILSNDLLQLWLHGELEILAGGARIAHSIIGDDAPVWTDAKTKLVEIIYGIDSMRSVNNGNISLRRIQRIFEEGFGVKLGNISRAFNEMRIRNDQTPYIDAMGEAVRERMEDIVNKNEKNENNKKRE